MQFLFALVFSSQGAAEAADQQNPKVNTVVTHSHDPLHGLQLQGVLVAVQHLLQVVMSAGRRQN